MLHWCSHHSICRLLLDLTLQQETCTHRNITSRSSQVRDDASVNNQQQQGQEKGSVVHQTIPLSARSMGSHCDPKWLQTWKSPGRRMFKDEKSLHFQQINRSDCRPCVYIVKICVHVFSVAHHFPFSQKMPEHHHHEYHGCLNIE